MARRSSPHFTISTKAIWPSSGAPRQLQCFWNALLGLACLAHLAIHSPLVHRGISRSRAGLYPVGIRVFDLQPRCSLNHRGGRWDSRDKAQRVTQILADFPSATQSPVLPTNRLSPII